MPDQSPASRQPDILASAPRCGARTRSGAPCRSPAVGGRRRCRMHGGARGSGAPRGNRHAWKHGLRSAAYRDTARYIRASSRFLAAARLALRASALGLP
ncbi:HGGxSTG domain-containing protein, partial [Rhizorhabdus sp.]|uniref:HGGxSTG domain-containing protein n=1 Tax=Rhizorhabdus sp. TaxID=1968843 RepID=UPI0025DFD2DE